ncbi:Endonuclease/exonuclease/phosphatase, partial [Coprinopsis sp. MPI-PUGE-AT-0042]
MVAGSRRPSKPKKNLKSSIRVATFNMRGGGSDDTINKWQHIRQIMKENKLGILAVQETHLKPNLVTNLNGQFEANTRIINSMYSLNPNAAGVAFVLNKSFTRWSDSKTYEIIPGRALLLSTPWKGNKSINILNVYAPNSNYENRNFWTHLSSELKDPKYKDLQPHIVLGDFNKVEDSIDRLPISPDDPACLEALRAFKTRLKIRDGWRDENPEEIEFTYMQDISTNTPSQSRIDRIYATDETLQNSRNFQSYHSGLSTADHKIVQFQLFDPSSPDIGTGRWAMPTYAVEDDELNESFRAFLEEATSQVSAHPTDDDQSEGENPGPQVVMARLKSRIRSHTKEWCKKRVPKLKQLIKTKAAEVARTNKDYSMSAAERREVSGRLENEIKTITAKIHSSNRLDTQTRYIVENEVVGKVWISAHQDKKPRDVFKALATMNEDSEEKLVYDSEGMAEIARAHHDSIQREGRCFEIPIEQRKGMIDETLEELTAKLSPEESTFLDQDFDPSEIRNTIKSMPKSKAPGLDGIPAEVWANLIAEPSGDPKADGNEPKDIAWLLSKVFSDIAENGVAEQTDFAKGWLCPIFKKKDRAKIENYRPITVLNADYKIMTKTLATRL